MIKNILTITFYCALFAWMSWAVVEGVSREIDRQEIIRGQ